VRQERPKVGRYKYIVNVNDGSIPLAPLPCRLSIHGGTTNSSPIPMKLRRRCVTPRHVLKRRSDSGQGQANSIRPPLRRCSQRIRLGEGVFGRLEVAGEVLGFGSGRRRGREA